jgi:ubiquinone/menaquinone biosynthesis C-methylase UbiE
MLARVISSEIKDQRFGQGLDFGCGSGRFSQLLAGHCDRLLGVDLIDAPRTSAPQHVTFERVQYPTKISLPDNSVDFLLASLVFQHLTDDAWLEEVTDELARVLKPGAKVIVVDDAISSAKHVRPRVPEALAFMLGLDNPRCRLINLDRRESHNLIVGIHGESL